MRRYACVTYFDEVGGCGDMQPAECGEWVSFDDAKDAIKEAMEKEREACIVVCMTLEAKYYKGCIEGASMADGAHMCSLAIRKRYDSKA